MSRRFSVPATVSVRELCRIGRVTYGMEDGPERPVRLRLGGGHERGDIRHRGRAALYVDVSAMPDDDREAALAILFILAVDLDCYEAGESLACDRLVEPQRTGRYLRPASDTGRSGGGAA